MLIYFAVDFKKWITKNFWWMDLNVEDFFLFCTVICVCFYFPHECFLFKSLGISESRVVGCKYADLAILF